MTGPLIGLRVLDLTIVLMGPYATQTMGDLGADVIKIEPPGGDTTRWIGPARNAGMGHMFLHANRNKRSIVLDLKDAHGREALLKLCETADILIFNMRRQALHRLGLGYPVLSATNPRLIVIALCGYGQDGPYADKPAYDDLIQGAASIPELFARATGGQPAYVPLALADRTVALHAVIAALAGVHARTLTGRGQEIQVPMFESIVQLVLSDHLSGKTFDPPIGGAGYARLLARQRRPYPTKDSFICAMVYTDKQWRSFLELLGEPERFENDRRFHSLTTRTENADYLTNFVGLAMRTKTTAEWLELLAHADIPAMPLHTPESLVQDIHLTATGFLRLVQHPTEGAILEMGIPTKWSETVPAVNRPAPTLGQHTREILEEAGVGAELVNKLSPNPAKDGE